MAFDTVFMQQSVKDFPKTVARGVGQVMFQDNMWTGILFLAGIFWGAYAEGFPLVAWGGLVGVLVSTLTGYILRLPDQNGAQGLWGFNGVLVGCAFPTFLGNTVWMWLGMILCSALSTIARSGMDNVFSRWKVSSFTFPFVFCTWIFLLSSRLFVSFPPEYMGSPEFAHGSHDTVSLAFGNLVIYWLRGISQVFLIKSWVCGAFFLAGLAASSWRAAMWAAISSAIALFIALVWGGPQTDIANGMYGFSPVLTGIALGATFCNFSWRSAIWTVCGVISTVFVQAAMNAFFAPMGLPTLTGPFCVTTWMFLLPAYKFLQPKPAK
jgi:urea transporter